MAEEEITTPSDESAGLETSTQGAEQTPQGDVQGQDSGQSVQVGQTGKETSSESKQGRSNRNWATERIVERAVKKQINDLENRITSLLQRQNPPATAPIQTQETLGDPDYNNLNGWLKAAVDKLLEAKLSETLPQHLNQFKGELRNVSKTQEARNYLISQEDIKENEEKLAEIEQIMKDNMLDYAAVHQPLNAVRKAVEIWRKGKVNPNTPTKAQMSSVSGGVGTRNKKNLSIEELKALQMKIASGLPKEEQEKVFAQIDELLV